MSGGPFLPLDEAVLVAPQIAAGDVAAAAAQGVTVIVNNRPDGEAADQPAGDAIATAAAAAGIGYVAIPVGHAGIGQAQVEAMERVLREAAGPVLAYCRSGTRSTYLWALARARMGEPGASLAAKAAAQGYDLSPLRGAIG